MRLLRHLFPPSVRRLFPEDGMQRLAQAISEGEQRHGGEIVFAVESDLSLTALWRGVQATQRAREVFAQLGVWDTEANNGVLIYLLLADHRIEIVADRGLDGRVGAEEWAAICRAMQDLMKEGQAEQAVLRGIEAISALLARHFPAGAGKPGVNELPDRPVVL